METTITIGNRPINIAATLKALAIYKRQFGKDYLTQAFEETSETDTDKQAEKITEDGFRLIWAMAKAVNKHISPPDRWLAEFTDGTDGFIEGVLKAKSLFIASFAVSSKKQKKSEGGGRELTTELLFAAAIRYGIGYEAASDMTIGELLLLIDELNGSEKETVRKATQEDFDRF